MNETELNPANPGYQMAQLTWSDASGWHVASLAAPYALNGATTLAIALRNTGAAKDIRILVMNAHSNVIETHRF